MGGPPRVFRRFDHGIRIDEELCTGCLACMDACPIKTVITVRTSEQGSKAHVAKVEDCIGCQKCYVRCPVKAISPFAMSKKRR